MKRKLAVFALLALIAAPVLAHVVESAQFAFVSRDHVTVESPKMPFYTGEPGTLLYFR